MKKLIFSIMMMAVLALPGFVNAATPEAQIGTTPYDTLEAAVAAATAGDEITLLEDVEISGSTLKIDKNLTINLNNHSISRTDSVFEVQGATLNIVGPGAITETAPDYGAIIVRGSANSSDTNYTVVNVGKDVKLTGWAGINIQPVNKTDKPYAYGVVVNIDGSITAVKDKLNGIGSGVYVNGYIQHTENAPIINLKNNASINAIGSGVYLAGYANLNVQGASITGEENAIGAKAGIINIEEGSVLKATGPDLTPTISYGDGINASGAAIQLESNSGYAGKVELNIKGGEITSENGYAIYEYLDSPTGTTTIEKISISGGEFNSAEGKDIFLVSDSFNETQKEFITGGTFSADPSDYVDPEYVSKTENGDFVIGKPATEQTTPEKNPVQNPTQNSGQNADVSEDIENPDTADNILTFVALSILSLAGISGVTVFYKKRFN